MALGKPVTASEEQEIVTLYSRGLKRESIAKQLRLALSTVSRVIRDSGLSVEIRELWTDDECALLSSLMLQKNGLTYARIAERVGRSKLATKRKAHELQLRLKRSTAPEPQDIKATQADHAEKHADACIALGGFPALSERFSRMVGHQREMVACLPVTYPAKPLQWVA